MQGKALYLSETIVLQTIITGVIHMHTLCPSLCHTPLARQFCADKHTLSRPLYAQEKGHFFCHFLTISDERENLFSSNLPVSVVARGAVSVFFYGQQCPLQLQYTTNMQKDTLVIQVSPLYICSCKLNVGCPRKSAFECPKELKRH